MFRYEIEPVSVGVAYKYDRWTGKSQQCTIQKGVIECRGQSQSICGEQEQFPASSVQKQIPEIGVFPCANSAHNE